MSHKTLLALAGMSLFAGGYATPACAADWPQAQCNPQRTGWTAEEVKPPYRLRWAWFGDSTASRREDFPAARTDGLADNAQPVVAGGVVYVGTVLGRVYALDAKTGKTLWRQDLPRPVMHTAAVAEGVVIVPCMDRAVHAFDARTGRPLWRLDGSAGFSGGILLADGLALAACRSGVVYAVNPASGELKWQRDLKAPVFNTPAADGGTVFVVSEDMTAHALRLTDGSPLWSVPLQGQSARDFWPVIAGGLVLFRTMYVSNCGKNFDECERILGGTGEGWPAQREALLKYLTDDPSRQTFFVLEAGTGKTKYVPPMGLVTTSNGPARPPAIGPDGRPYTVWCARGGRWKGGTFWTKYTPQIDPMDLATGDRVLENLPPIGDQSIEIDNDFLLSGGGRYLYGKNSFRGTFFEDTQTGQAGGVLRDYSDGFPLAGKPIVFYGKPGTGVPGPGGGTGESAVTVADGCLFLNTGPLVAVESAATEGGR